MSLAPEYIAGFVDGEGCFTITISKHKEKRLGLDARLHFQIEVRDDDEALLKKIQNKLECGRLYHLTYERYGWNPHSLLKVSSFKDIQEKIIPFFIRYPLQGKKRKSFLLFCEAAKVFTQKKHLTQQGIEELRLIQSKMNQYSKKRKRHQ